MIWGAKTYNSDIAPTQVLCYRLGDRGLFGHTQDFARGHNLWFNWEGGARCGDASDIKFLGRCIFDFGCKQKVYWSL